ncbi:MAG: hypothetical protein ABJF10_21725, partial [Chthoniobacter sp.]|uniref:hypothetical protein n=1 Tax=Chthoniobacter sp. TaxID=2510640 RepID=UPI0032A6A94F
HSPRFVNSHITFMKRITVPAALALTMAIFSACVDDQPKKHPKSGFHPPSSTTDIANNAAPDENQPDKPPADVKPAPDKPQAPAVPETPPAKGEIPYAKPVPGKPGFVFSPYDQYKGYIDVRGFPPGTEVKDPYSGKSFLVP